MAGTHDHMTEEPALIGVAPGLVGVCAAPSASAGRAPATGILLLNSGLVHRVGPGRLYVRLARRLAQSRGTPVLRFDYSGIGDSPARADQLPVEQSWVVETGAAMDWLAHRHGCTSFYLMGLCSGAVAAFRSACHDPRIAGLVLLNAQGYTTNWEWRSHVESRGWMRDYRRKFFSLQAWRRVLSGQSQYVRFVRVAIYRLFNVFKRPARFSSTAHELGEAFAALLERGVRVLLINSEGDPSIDYLRELLGPRLARLEAQQLLEHHIVAGADHTFAQTAHHEEIMLRTEQWLAAVTRPERSRPASRESRPAVAARATLA